MMRLYTRCMASLLPTIAPILSALSMPIFSLSFSSLSAISVNFWPLTSMSRPSK